MTDIKQIAESLSDRDCFALSKILEKRIKDIKSGITKSYDPENPASDSEFKLRYPFLDIKKRYAYAPITEENEAIIKAELVKTGRYQESDIMTERRVIEPSLLSRSELEKALSDRDFMDIVNPFYKQVFSGITIYNKAK